MTPDTRQSPAEGRGDEDTRRDDGGNSRNGDNTDAPATIRLHSAPVSRMTLDIGPSLGGVTLRFDRYGPGARLPEAPGTHDLDLADGCTLRISARSGRAPVAIAMGSGVDVGATAPAG